MSAVISKFLATGSPTPYATRLCTKDLYCFGTFKNASNMTITLLTATEKMIVFPRASKQTKNMCKWKKKVRIITNLSGCSPFLYYIPECLDNILVLPRKWPTSTSPLNSSTYKANYLHHLDAKKKKKWRGTVICFLVIVAHNVRELMCYI